MRMAPRRLEDFAWIMEYLCPKYVFDRGQEYYDPTEIQWAMLCEIYAEKYRNFLKYGNCPK